MHLGCRIVVQYYTNDITNIMLTDSRLVDDAGIDDDQTPTTTKPHGYTPLAETPKWGLGPHVSELASAAACAEH